MTPEPKSDTLPAAQPPAALGDQHAQIPQVDDREPQPLTEEGLRSRGLVPRLRSFYGAVRLKTEVDPLALVTFLGGLIPGSIALWNWVIPTTVEVVPPEAVTFKSEEQQQADGSSVEILRIAAPFAFRNPHSTKRAEVKWVSAKLTVGSKEALFQAGSYIHSYRDELDSKKLRINPIGDFGPISIAADSATESKEIYFFAKPAGPPDRFKYAFTIEEFRKRVDAGEPVKIEFVVTSDRETFTIPFEPKVPKDTSKRLGGTYKWDVQVDKAK